MTAQLSFYEAPQPIDDMRAQFMRLHPEMRVWLDWHLERGAIVEVVTDREAECDRLLLAALHGLRWVWVERHRGLRRKWLRKATERDSLYEQSRGVAHLAYEPRMGRQLGETGPLPEQRSHWPRRLQ